MLKERFEARRVVLEKVTGKVRVWQWLETIMDQSMREAFLLGAIGDGNGFEATENVERTIAARVRDI